MQVSRITLPSACDVRAWLRDNWNGFETHDRGGRTEDSKGECVRKKKIIPKCVAGVVARVKSCRKKSFVFTLVCLHTRMLNASADASASALGHQINTQSN